MQNYNKQLLILTQVRKIHETRPVRTTGDPYVPPLSLFLSFSHLSSLSEHLWAKFTNCGRSIYLIQLLTLSSNRGRHHWAPNNSIMIQRLWFDIKWWLTHLSFMHMNTLFPHILFGLLSTFCIVLKNSTSVVRNSWILFQYISLNMNANAWKLKTYNFVVQIQRYMKLKQ